MSKLLDHKIGGGGATFSYFKSTLSRFVMLKI